MVYNTTLEDLSGWLQNCRNIKEAAWKNNCPNLVEITRYTLEFVLKRTSTNTL
jgi:hypothetical protein